MERARDYPTQTLCVVDTENFVGRMFDSNDYFDALLVFDRTRGVEE